MIKSAVVGLVAISTLSGVEGARERRTRENSENNKANVAVCSSITVAGAETWAKDAVAKLKKGVHVDSDQCLADATPDNHFLDLNLMKDATAKAFAGALAFTLGHCSATGNGVACSHVYAKAEAHAQATAYAFAKAMADVDNHCGCEIDIDVFAKAAEDVMVSAMAHLDKEECADEHTPYVNLFDYDADYEEDTVTAVAKIVAGVVSNADGCGAFAVARAEAGDDFAVCGAGANATTDYKELDAFVSASANVVDFACAPGTDVDIKSEQNLVAVAEAWAKVVVKWAIECSSSGEFIDELALASVVANVDAEAVAFADGFSTAILAVPWGCGCGPWIKKDMDDGLGDAFAMAAVHVNEYGGATGSGPLSSFSAADIEGQLARQTVEVTADALAKVKIDYKGRHPECEYTVDADVDVTVDPEVVQDLEVCGECVGRNQKCAGDLDDPHVSPCCNENDVCVQKSDHRAACKKPSKVNPRDVIRECIAH